MGLEAYLDDGPPGVEHSIHMEYSWYYLIRSCVCYSTSKLRPVTKPGIPFVAITKFESDNDSSFVRSLCAWMKMDGNIGAVWPPKHALAAAAAIWEWLGHAILYTRLRTTPEVPAPLFIKEMFKDMDAQVAHLHLVQAERLAKLFYVAAKHGCGMRIH